MRNLSNFLNPIETRTAYPLKEVEKCAINRVLIQYGVKIDSIIEGARVIQYRATLSPTVNTSKIMRLESNLKIALNTNDMVMSIEGNQLIIQKEGAKNKVNLASFYNDEYADPSGISIIIGEDVNGNHIYADLAAQPHMLVAGTTGSGKSMFLHQIILSILMKYPNTNIYAIDTKNVEFNPYRDIPTFHLVTEAQDAAQVLSNLVDNMNRRYEVFAQNGYRDITHARSNGYILNPIVCVIDEFADLIMQKEYTKEIEANIVKLAQKSRAAGIHLVIATQRPTADVITGLIKANIPSRVCLKVNGAMESRIILDRKGGENLLGNGDLLFLGKGMFEPIRIQACYVDTTEMNGIGNELTVNSEYPIKNGNSVKNAINATEKRLATRSLNKPTFKDKAMQFINRFK